MLRLRNLLRPILLASALVSAAAPSVSAQEVPPGFEDRPVATLAAPTVLAFTPDGRLLIGTQLGQIYVYQHGALVARPALDLGASSCAYRERGLAGIAVDPNFAANRYVYVTYVFNKFGNCDAEYTSTPVGRVSRFQLADDNTIDRAAELVLIDNIPSIIGVHNVDDVEFGKDGYLYVSVGDGGCDYAGDSGCFNSNNASQDPHSLVGKILRITRDGGIPPGNPFTGPNTVRCNVAGGTQPGMTCQEVFALGLRNPWRISFDPNAAGTRFFINDVGGDFFEEIDEGIAGANYGWNLREGWCGPDGDCTTPPAAGFTDPVFAYGRGGDGCSSVTGGAFVPNGAWTPEFNGVYLFSDYVCGIIFKLVRQPDGRYARQTFVPGLGGATAVDLLFGPDGDRTSLYYTTFRGGGEVRRLAFVGALNRQPAAVLTVNPSFGPPPLSVRLDARSSSDPDGDPLTFSWDFGDGTTAGSGAEAQHTYSTAGTYFATVRVTDSGGAASTATQRIDVGNTPPAPTILAPGAGHQFAVGDAIVLQGRASDTEDGTLPDSSLSWRVIRHHNTHTHPFLPPTSGNNITVTAPGPEDIDAGGTSHLEVHLTATDSKGRATTVSRVLMPRTVRINFVTEPPGAVLVVENSQVTAPVSVVSWVNYGLPVDAPSQLMSDGSSLTFASWSDGGAASHTIASPASETTYTARFTVQSTPESTPFHGTPAAIPGTVQAEDFDNGPSGLAYADSTGANLGGQYRPASGVDIESSSDAGGGHNVGWAVAGEWLKYTVDVATAGTYDLEVRVASNGAGGTFHIEAGGVNLTGPMTVPNTGGWQTWTTVQRPDIALSAGRQVWRLVMDSNGGTGGTGNFNELRVTADPGGGGSTPYLGVPRAVPGTIEAEDFDEGGAGTAYVDATPGNSGGQYRNTAVDIQPAADSGGGYNVGWAVAGEWLNYTVNVGASGAYDFEVRVASDGTGGTFHIEAGGVNLTGPMTVPNTGGWQSWVTIRRNGVNLTAGRQIWRLVMDTNGATNAVGNFNHVRVVAAQGPGGGPTPYGGTPVALPGTIEAENFDEGGANVAYLDTTAGNSGGAHRATDVDVESASENLYNVGWIVAGEWLHYTVNAAAAGTYDIEVRVASGGAGGTFHIEVDGVDRTGPLTVPNTGAWQNWTTMRAAGISLNAGPQKWRVVMDSNGATAYVGNINWIRVVSAAGGAALVREPYLQQVTHGSAIVVWTTRDPGAGEVRYSGPDGMTFVVPSQAQLFTAAHTGLGFDFYQHEARLTGLTAASRYTYDVFVNGADATAGQDTFTTAPPTGTGTIRFIAFGDSGIGSAQQRQLATRMTADSFDLALHGGDVAYGTATGVGGGSYRQFDEWVFGVYAPWLRSRPMFPAIGNHDNEVANARPYRDVFVLPEHGATPAYPDHAERYYSFDYGPVHFVALDTELAFIDPARRQAQLAWLDADLSATAQPWRVVYLHRPPYSSGSHHGSELTVRQAFGPLFEKHGVQLVIAAHEHDYERSVPWREHVSTGGAVTYVVSGGGGAPLYPSGTGAWTAASASLHHYVRASVGGCSLQLEAVGLDGAVFDRYTLDRCAQAGDAAPPQVQVVSPGAGAQVSGTVDVQASASDDGQVVKVDLYVDGVLRAIDATAPYAWKLDTTTLSNGQHVIAAHAHDGAGRSTRSASITVAVANGATAADVVLYSSDVSVIRGNWNRLTSTTGAGGMKMTSVDQGWSTAAALAAPDHYFEATFNAPAGAYRIWLRLRGAADSKFNESVWVQLSDAVDGAGAPLWRIGTDRALLVNLEDCGGCGVSGWGWQDNAWWLGESSVVRFTGAGPHTIRIQTREDGVDVDQIVLSPATFFTSPPGPVRDDTRIVPK